MDSIPGSGRFPGRAHGNPLWYSRLENPHGQRSLTGYSPYGCTESDMTEVNQNAHKYYSRLRNNSPKISKDWKTYNSIFHNQNGLTLEKIHLEKHQILANPYKPMRQKLQAKFKNIKITIKHNVSKVEKCRKQCSEGSLLFEMLMGEKQKGINSMIYAATCSRGFQVAQW